MTEDVEIYVQADTSQAVEAIQSLNEETATIGEGAGNASAQFATAGEEIQGTSNATASTIEDGGEMIVTTNDKSEESHHSLGKAMGATGMAASMLGLGIVGVVESYTGMEKAQTRVSVLQRTIELDTDKVAKAQDAYNTAVSKYGPNSEQAQAAARKLDEANQKLTNDNEKLKEAQDHASESQMNFAMNVIPSVMMGISGFAGLIGTIPELQAAWAGANDILSLSFDALDLSMLPILIIVGAIAIAAYLIITHWSQIKPFFEGLWNGVKEVFTAVWNFLKPFLETIWKGIQEVANVVWGLIKDYIIKPAQEYWTILQMIWNFLKPYLTEAWNAIKAAANAVWPFLEAIIVKPMQNVWTVLQTIWNFLKPFLIEAWNFLKPVAEAAFNFIMNVIIIPMQRVWNFLQEMWNFIKPFLVDAWNFIKGVAEAAWNFIVNVIINPMQRLWDFLKEMWNFLKPFLEGIWNALKGLAESIWNGIKQYIIQPMQDAWNMLQSIWNAVKGFLEGLWNGIKSTATSIWNGIKDAVIGPINTLKGLLEGAWNEIKSVAESVWNALVGFFSGVANRIMGALKPLLDFFGKIGDAVGKVGSTIGGGLNWLTQRHQSGGVIPGPAYLLGGDGNIHEVGEAGPEILVLPENQWQSSGIMGGGGGKSVTMYNSFNIKSSSPRQAAQEIGSVLKIQGANLWTERS